MVNIATALVASVLLAAVHDARAVETWVAATDARVQVVGRYRAETTDGSVSFDWEGVYALVNVQGATYVKAVISMSAPDARTKFVVDEPRSSLSSQGFHQGFVLSTFWVSGGDAGAVNGTYVAAAGLDDTAAFTVRLFHDLEPNFHGSRGQGYGVSGFVTLRGFLTDGAFGAPAPPPNRTIEWLGDSITAGFGARGGELSATAPCQANQYTASAFYSYSRELCDSLAAACTDISWMGKGMFANCCNDTKAKMPTYFRQTMGIDSSPTWDFRTAPDALAINLGTNDFGSYNGTQAWLTAFEGAYVDFVVGALAAYRAPQTQVLLVQGPFANAQLTTALKSIAATLVSRGVAAHYLVAAPPGAADGCQGIAGIMGWT